MNAEQRDPRYDYINQAWTGLDSAGTRQYLACGHSETMNPETMLPDCCFGGMHAGETIPDDVQAQITRHENETPVG